MTHWFGLFTLGLLLSGEAQAQTWAVPTPNQPPLRQIPLPIMGVPLRPSGPPPIPLAGLPLAFPRPDPHAHWYDWTFNPQHFPRPRIVDAPIPYYRYNGQPYWYRQTHPRASASLFIP